MAGAGAPPGDVDYCPVDFEKTDLADGLASSSFEPTRPSFFCWLGVAPYLTSDALDSTFGFAIVALGHTASLVGTLSHELTFLFHDVSNDMSPFAIQHGSFTSHLVRSLRHDRA